MLAALLSSSTTIKIKVATRRMQTPGALAIWVGDSLDDWSGS